MYVAVKSTDGQYVIVQGDPIGQAATEDEVYEAVRKANAAARWVTYRKAALLGLSTEQINSRPHMRIEAPNGVWWTAFNVGGLL